MFDLLGRPKRASLFAASAIAIAASISSAYAQEEQQRAFNIPEQPLASALVAFGQQSGRMVLVDSALVNGRRAPAVQGSFTPGEALRRLLAGTGLTAAPDANGSFVLADSSSPTRLGAAEAASSDEEIVVTGTRLRGAQGSSPVIGIDRGDIDQSGYQSSGDLIRSLPQSFRGGTNATVISAAEDQNVVSLSGASSANLRGLGSDSTLTLVNGRRLAYSDTGNAVDISAIPLQAIERVDVLTDGASAIYGADAVGGVVNFILRRDYDGLQTSATFGDSTRGSGASQQYDLLFGKEWGSGGAILSYEFFQQDPIYARDRRFTSASTAGTSLVPDTQRNSFFGMWRQDLGGGASAFAQGLYTTRSSDAVADLGYSTPGRLSYTRADVEQYGVSFGLTQQFGESWEVSLVGDLARNSTSAPQTDFLNGVQTGGFAQDFDTELHQVELSANGNLFELPAGSVALALGASYRQDTLDLSQVGIAISGERQIESFYAELNVPLLSGVDGSSAPLLSATLAGRHDDYSDFGGSTIPKIGLVFTPMDDLQLRASWGQSFRAPTLLQVNNPQNAILFNVPTLPSGTATVLVHGGGNPSLGPEEAENLTISSTYQPDWLNGFTLDVTYFDIEYSNRISRPVASFFTALIDPTAAPFVDFTPTPAEQAEILANAALFLNLTPGPYNPAIVAAIVETRQQNALSQQATGFDVLARYRFDSRFGDVELSLNASQIDMTRRVSSAQPERQLSGTVFNIPEWRARAGASWSRDGWSSAFFVNYSDEEFSPSLSQSVDAWITLDGQVAYEFEQGPLANTRISLSVENLTDEDPPFAAASLGTNPGLNYDSTNASPVGRYVRLQVSHEW